MTLHMIDYARGGNTWLTILSHLMIRTQTLILHWINQNKIQKNKGKYVRLWQDGGNFFDSTLSKILVCLLYSLGTSISWLNFPVSLASLIEIPLREHSHSSSWNMGLHCCSRCCSHLTWILCPCTPLVIMGLIHVFLQSTEWMIIGRKEVLVTASLHMNFGSKVESHRYPRMRSSPPRSVIRNLITSCCVPVCTSVMLQ